MAVEDIFDVVNERDEVIDRLPRKEVHARSLFHRAVHVWIFNSRGQLLIQKRSPAKDLHPNVWDCSTSGHVDSGESYATAVDREIGEEIGLVPAPELKELGKTQPVAVTGHEFIVVYRGESEGPFQPCPKEISEVKWVDTEMLTLWMEKEPGDFSPAFRAIWLNWHYNGVIW